MPEFTHPLAQFAQGVQGGMNLGLQVDQMRQQRKAQEWQRDFQLAGHFMDYANAKGATNDTKAQAMNSANQLIQKWYPDMKFPTLDAKQIQSYGPVLKAGGDLIKTLQKDPSKFEFVIGEWGRHNADWVANAGKDASLSEAEDSARKQVSETLTSMGKSQEGKDKAAGKGAKTPDEVLKEMFDLNKSVVGMQQLDQQTANLMQIAPDAAKSLVGNRLSPEQLGQVKGMASARMRQLNALLPEDRRLREISPKTFKALIEGKHPDTGEPLPGGPQTPEAIFRRAYIAEGQ